MDVQLSPSPLRRLPSRSWGPALAALLSLQACAEERKTQKEVAPVPSPVAAKPPTPPTPPDAGSVAVKAPVLPLPVANGVSGKRAATFRFYDRELDSDWSSESGWGFGAKDAQAVGLHRSLSLASLKHLVASAGGEPLGVVFLAEADSESSAVEVPFSVAGTGTENGDWKDPEAAPPGGTMPVRVAFPNATTLEALGKALAKVPGRPVVLVLGPAPCRKAPEGMRCVEGTAVRPTVYVTEQPLSAELLAQCAKQKRCAGLTPGSWLHAYRACQFAGMRLPHAQEASALPAGTVAWTQDWDLPANAKPGACHGLGACGFSAKRRLTDGTAQPPSRALKGATWCASDRHVLTSNTHWTEAAEAPEQPLLPEPEKAVLAARIEHDPLEDKGVCGEEVRETWAEHVRKGGRSDLTCRDPHSYILSNEPFRWSVAKAIRGLGGAYVGVASDQAYDFISAMRAEWAWTGDYDPNVYRVHRLLRALVLAAETPAEFVAYYAPKSRAAVADIVGKQYDAQEAAQLLRFWDYYRARLEKGYTAELKPFPVAWFGWLSHKPNYDYIRKMFLQGRIVAIKSDLMGKKAFKSVGDAARALGVPMRMFYLSNAPTAWGGQVNADYQAVIGGMPYDDFSVVLTTYNGSTAALGQRTYWNYYLLNAQEFSRRISAAYSSYQPIWDVMTGNEEDVRTLALPARYTQPRLPAPARVVTLGGTPR